MRFRVRVQKDPFSGFQAFTLDKPNCNAQGETREEALENIRDEIRYRVEYCPCSWVTDDYVQLEIVE